METNGGGLRYSPRRIYLASSWRNEQQPAVVARLRDEGHEVYDFRNPAPGQHGFSWRQVRPEPPPWSAEQTREVLAHAVSEHGFKLDFAAMQWADTFVMLQPCGRSAALELGWACGAGKLALVLLADGQEPELMLKCADRLCTSLDEVAELLRRWDPVARTFVTSAAQRRRECRTCTFAGADPDGPYCVQPHVAEGMPHGVALHTLRVAERCPAPEHPQWRGRAIS